MITIIKKSNNTDSTEPEAGKKKGTKSTGPPPVAVTALPQHDWRHVFRDFFCASTVCRLFCVASTLFYFCPGIKTDIVYHFTFF